MATKLDFCDIQGNITRGYRFPKYKQLFGTIWEDVERWRGFLAELVPRITTARDAASNIASATNIGISHAGLSRLCPSVARAAVEPFPAFSAGMGERSRRLGDPPGIDWQKWEQRDVWIQIHANDADLLELEVEAVVALARRWGIALDDSSTMGEVIDDQGKRREHFGFRDGIANPVFDGMDDQKELAGNGKKVAGAGAAGATGATGATGEWVPISTGEFLIGFPNEQGVDVLEAQPALRRIMQNGTFAVLRVLRQDVQGFHKYVDEKCKTLLGLSNQSGPDLAAKMIGRTRDGRALGASDDGNDFDYAGDPGGAKCPLGAHVRRANPRTDGEHRLIRRGIPYGAYVEWGQTPRTECGLYFIAINASIEAQFEFMQKNWLNGQAGKLNGSKDPLTTSSEHEPLKMAIEGDASSRRAPVLLLDIPAFVTCLGGQYYFMPGMAGLQALCERPESRANPTPSLVGSELRGALP